MKYVTGKCRLKQMEMCILPRYNCSIQDRSFVWWGGTHILPLCPFSPRWQTAFPQTHKSNHSKLMNILSVWGGLNIFFSIFIVYAWFGMLSTGRSESFLLSKYEPLTPNIDGVMALWTFRRLQNTEIGQKLAKIGPLDPSFYFFAPALSSVFAQFFQGLHWLS